MDTAIYNKNIEALKEYRRPFYDKFLEDKETEAYKKPGEIEEVCKSRARDGNYYLSVKTEDGKEVRFNSSYRPLKEAEKWADQFNYTYLDIRAVIYGIGSGIYLQFLLKKLPEDSLVLIYEPDLWFFDQIMGLFDISFILSDKRVVIFTSPMERLFKYYLLATQNYSGLNTGITSVSLGYDKLFREDSVEIFYKDIDDSNETIIVNMNTTSHFGKAIALNVIKNLKFIRQSAALSEVKKEIPKDMPAIVVAAGPSLDKNIDALKKAEKKAFILATDTAVRQLIKHDIRFDAMITVDPKKPDNYISDPICKDVPLFCVIESNPAIMNFHTGKKIFCLGTDLIDLIYDKYGIEKAQYSTGGSVATAAAGTLNYLGFKNIILVGQDLAYNGNITHAGGEVSRINDEESSITYVDGIDGNKVKTRFDWKYYLDWFENYIRSNPDTNFIDATEGGALIHGSEVITLEEALDKYCDHEFDYKKFLSDFKPTFDEDQYSEIAEDLKKFPRQLSNIRERVEDGMKICEDTLKIIDKDHTDRRIDKNIHHLKNINNFIDKQAIMVLIYQMINEDIQMPFFKLNTMTEDEKANKEQAVTTAKVLYEATLKNYDVLMNALKEIGLAS
jgi:hypothetical protein